MTINHLMFYILHFIWIMFMFACMGTGAALAAPDASSSIPSSLLQTVASQAAGGTRTGTSAQQFTLKNGMQLIVQPDRRAPTA
ncbi:hypothetical protein, partial [Algoriella sp.]|uniref:hypothetical protein n=1 Tax=Algoriella sp. TaxID=1872434 RepID=UPI0030435D72